MDPLELDHRRKVESAAKLTEMASEDSSYVVLSPNVFMYVSVHLASMYDLSKHAAMAKFSL